jgi:hypothetical protein
VYSTWIGSPHARRRQFAVTLGGRYCVKNFAGLWGNGSKYLNGAQLYGDSMAYLWCLDVVPSSIVPLFSPAQIRAAGIEILLTELHNVTNPNLGSCVGLLHLAGCSPIFKLHTFRPWRRAYRYPHVRSTWTSAWHINLLCGCPLAYLIRATR